MTEEKKLSKAAERQAQKEAEAAKQAEIEAAAAAAAMEEEKAILRDKLMNRKTKELRREMNKAVRKITDEARVLSAFERAAIERNRQSAMDRFKTIRQEYEEALKALKAAHIQAETKLQRLCSDAVEEIREVNKPKFVALENEMALCVENQAAALQGFKEKLESATLEDLQEMWGEKRHEPQGHAEARA